MKKLLPLLIISFLAWLPTTDAQLTISGEDVVVCDNGTVNIDISVSNFIDITSAQFGVTWDPDVVQFNSVSNNMPASALYNTVNATNGELRFSWFDANPPPGYTPVGPPAGSQIIFTISFTIVGDYVTDNFTSIDFGSVPGFTMEVASTSGIIPNGSIVLNSGSVTLDDVVPPTITCPANVTVTAGAGQPSASVVYAAPMVTDNCDNTSSAAVCNPASGSNFLVGTTNVNCVATDAAGNSSNCSFTVTVDPSMANPNALTFTADDFAIVCNDTVVDVPVRVENFIQMTSAQFALIWDELVLDYTGYTDSLNTNGHPTALYNDSNAPTGEFRFSWFDADGVPGEDLADSTVIFTLHFKVLDENELPDTIFFANVPGFNIELTDTSGIIGPGDYAFNDAIISVVPDTIPPSITCPPDQALMADANCEAMLLDYTSMASASDNCSDPADIVISQLPIAGTVITDTTEIMLIATDEAGLKDTCYFNVNFVDDTDPVVSCPADVTIGNDLGNCTAIVSLVATATDNCGVSNITDDAPLGDEYPLGTTTVTFTATDINGNVASCQTTVTVNDTEAPTITCPADISMANDPGNCSAVVTWAAPTAVDNCSGNITITCIPPSGTEFPVGDSTVVCIAEDLAGNMDTCTFVVSVYDDEPLMLQCLPDTSILVPFGTVDTIVESIYLFSFSDNCSLDTLYYNFSGAIPSGGGDGDDASGTAFPVGTTTVTYFGIDNVGNIGSCSLDVVIEEDSTLTIICSPDQTVDVDSGMCSAAVTGLTASVLPLPLVQDTFFTVTGATVNSDSGLDASGTYNAGTSTITFYAVSVIGDTVTCTTTVIVNDTIPPVITCPADISQGTDLGNCSAVVTWASPTVVDNCTNVTITCIPPSGTEFPLGDSTVVCIVEDPGGNMDTCTFVVSVFDNEPPTLQCVPDTTVLVPAGTLDTIVNDIYLFSLSDNCNTDTLYYALTGALTGDGSGVDVSGTAFPVGTTTVTYFTGDNAGNVGSCSFDVNIVEDVLLAITCSPAQTVDNDPGICTANVTGVTADAQPAVSIQSSYYETTGATVGNGTGLDASGIYDGGLTTVTFYAVSTLGDTVSCSTTVQVNDTELPIFTNCPTDTVTMNNTTDQCGLLFSGSVVPVANDNCPNLDLSYNFTVGDLVPVGTNTIVATAMDMSGNASTCTYVLKVVDSQPPTFNNCTNGNSISRVNDPDMCGAVVAFGPAVTAQDNCSLLAFTETTPGNGDFFPIGNTIVTYTAVDNVGNVSTCEITVTVSDAQPPALTCPSNLPPVNTDLNQCSAMVNFVTPTATDNCSVVSFGPTTPIGPVFPEGVNTVSYEATDAAGNTTTCTFTVTVVDNQFPFIPNMPADLTVYTTTDCGANVFWIPPSPPIDNCGIDTFGPSGGMPGDFFGVGTQVVKYVAMDVNGNITVENLNITVLDTLPPTIDCPAGISVTVDGATIDDPDGFLTSIQQIDCDNIQLDYAALMATDACGVSSLNQTAGLPSGSQFPIGTTIMSFEAMDNNGNTSVCSFAINVLDYQIAPATVSQGLVCEGGSVTFSVGALPGATYIWTTGSDVVSNDPTFTITDAALNQSGIYTVVVSTAYCDIQFTTELNVSAVPVVTIDANDVQCTSSGLPLVLTGQNSSTANVDVWTWTYPNNTMAAGQTQTIQNPTVNDSGNYCVTATTLFGCSATACTQVTVSNGPPPPSLFGSTASLCLGNDVTITNVNLYSGNNVMYSWYAVPAAGSGLNQSINNPNIKPTPTMPGSYTYYNFVTVDGCVSDTAEWSVVVEAAPVISLTVTGETQCVDGGSNITLMDNGTGAVSWMWSGPIPLPPVNTNSVVLQNVVPAYSGTYTVVATSAIGCTSSASTPLTFTAAPAPPTLTPSSTSVCEGGSVTLVGSQYNAPVNYIWIGNGVPPNSQNNNQIDASPIGTGDFDYSFAAYVNGCYSDTATVTVTVTPAPAFAIDVIGDTNCVDGTSSVSLTATGSGLLNIEWTNGNGTVLSNANPLVLNNVTSANSGEFFLTATSQGCLGYGSTTLSISDGIDGLTANSSMADCATATVTLEASSIANANYSWFKPNGQLFATTQNTTLSNANDGEYTVVAAANGCTDTATATVNLPNSLKANDKIVLCVIGQPQEFNILAMDIYETNQPFTITILQNATSGIVTHNANQTDSIYTYKPNAGFWGSDFIIYQICYTECPDFCSTAKVTFEVSPDPMKCVITTVISPNDDGYNDEFVISCVENDGYPLNTLYIFNQWGDKVYEAAPYKNDWHGTYDGKDLPDGTYFFIFQRDPDTPAQKGFVMIYR
ncbi:MAG: HYR domain-containing protein [Bacteroidetes bacterium]|nr:HYR domain-containing protein [Bacteroidota bacterium]